MAVEESKVKEHLCKLLAKADLTVYSRRNARRELEAHFGFDMKTTKWRKFIKDCVTSFVQDTCHRIKLPVPARYNQQPAKKSEDAGTKIEQKPKDTTSEEKKRTESAEPPTSCAASPPGTDTTTQPGSTADLPESTKPPSPGPTAPASEKEDDTESAQKPTPSSEPTPPSQNSTKERTPPVEEKPSPSSTSSIPPDFVSEEPVNQEGKTVIPEDFQRSPKKDEGEKHSKLLTGGQDIFDSLAEQMIADEQSKSNSEKEESSRTGKLYITEAESKSRSNSEKGRRRSSRNTRRSHSRRSRDRRRRSGSRDRRSSRNRSRRQDSRNSRYSEPRRSHNPDRYKRRESSRRGDSRRRESSRNRISRGDRYGRRSSYEEDHKKLMVDLLRYVKDDEERRRTYNLSNKRVSNFRDRYPSFRSKTDIEDAVLKVKAFKSFFRDGLLHLESTKSSHSAVKDYFRGRGTRSAGGSRRNSPAGGSRRGGRTSARASRERERTKSPKKDHTAVFDRAPKPPSADKKTSRDKDTTSVFDRAPKPPSADKKRPRENESPAKPRKKRAVPASLELDMNALEAVSLDELSNDSRGTKKKASPERISQRQKQIDLTKAKQNYIDYCEQVPKVKRTNEDPRTPDPSEDISNKRFKGKLKKWRSSLHTRSEKK